MNKVPTISSIGKGRLRKIGLYYAEFAEILSTYENYLIKRKNEPEWKVKENFLKALQGVTLDGEVVSNSNCVSISCGENSIAFVTEDGKIEMVGAQTMHPVILGKDQSSTKSMLVLDKGDKFVKAKCGPFHSIALTAQNRVITWGSNVNHGVDPKRPHHYNAFQLGGQLGRGDAVVLGFPGEVESITGVVLDISVGAVHCAVLTTDGLFTWGLNADGQLGYFMLNRTHVSKPYIVQSLNGIKLKQVACGGYHTLALTHDQIILSWGDNRRGQLGTPQIQTCSSTPSQVNALSGEKVKQISAGNYHSACITDGGVVYTWGSNVVGELGRKGKEDEPGRVDLGVECGPNATAALTEIGTVYIWGRLCSEMMFTNQLTPRRIDSESIANAFVTKIACGLTHYVIAVDPVLSELVQLLIEMGDVNAFFDTNLMTEKLLQVSESNLKLAQDRAQWTFYERTKQESPLVRTNTSRLYFNLNELLQAQQTLTVTNFGKQNVRVSFITSTPPSNSCAMVFDPPKATIRPGKDLQFKVNLAYAPNSMPASYSNLFTILYNTGTKQNVLRSLMLFTVTPPRNASPPKLRPPSPENMIVADKEPLADLDEIDSWLNCDDVEYNLQHPSLLSGGGASNILSTSPMITTIPQYQPTQPTNQSMTYEGALSISLYKKKKGWGVLQEVKEGDTLRITKGSGKWVVLKTIAQRSDIVNVFLVDLMTGEMISSQETTVAKIPLTEGASTNKECFEIQYKLQRASSRLQFTVAIWTETGFIDGRSVIFSTAHKSLKTILRSSQDKMVAMETSTVQQVNSTSNTTTEMQMTPPLKTPFTPPSLPPNQPETPATPFTVEIPQVRVALYHKPRRCIGVLKEISEGESIRVTAKTGKWVALKIVAPKYDNVKVTLFDLNKNVESSPVDFKMTKPKDKEPMEVKFKLTVASSKLQFVVNAVGENGNLLEGKSVIFATHSSGRSKGVDAKRKFPYAEQQPSIVPYQFNLNDV